MNNTAINIAVTEAKKAAKNKKSLRGKLRAAMKAVQNHWLVTNENSQLYAAVAAVYLLSDETDQARIKAEMEQLKILSAMVDGIPIDLNAVTKLKNPIGIMKIWKEINL